MTSNDIYTREQLEAIGGKYWQTRDGNVRRVYFDDLGQYYGIVRQGDDVFFLDGEEVREETGWMHLNALRDGKVYYNLRTDTFCADLPRTTRGDNQHYKTKIIDGIRAKLAAQR